MKKYDSFLSYATEDMQIVAELAGALKARDFKIWYDQTSLNVGDNLLDSIGKGLSDSSSGILFISPDYLKKPWTNHEMDVLIRQNIENNKKIYPIWHNVKKSDVENRHPGLAGIIALKTDEGLPVLVSKLTSALSRFAPTIGVVPEYESPVFRFLQGRGEITIGPDGPATTLWEFLIYADNSSYPINLDRNLYSKEELLVRAAQLLPHIPNEVRKWVNEEGRQKIWDMCLESGINPRDFE